MIEDLYLEITDKVRSINRGCHRRINLLLLRYGLRHSHAWMGTASKLNKNIYGKQKNGLIPYCVVEKRQNYVAKTLEPYSNGCVSIIAI